MTWLMTGSFGMEAFGTIGAHGTWQPINSRAMGAGTIREGPADEQDAPPRRRARPNIVRQSVYLPRKVHEALRAIAFETDRKVHDIIVEGIDAPLQKYGHPTVEGLRNE